MARENGDFSRCADPVPLRFRAKVKEGRILFPPKASNCLLLRRHGLDNFDLTAIVAAALLAHSVRQVQSTALGACNETGDSQLPGGAASLIASCFGYFSLRYCHFRDTSLVSNCLKQCIFQNSVFVLIPLQQLSQHSQARIGFLFASARTHI